MSELLWPADPATRGWLRPVVAIGGITRATAPAVVAAGAASVPVILTCWPAAPRPPGSGSIARS